MKKKLILLAVSVFLVGSACNAQVKEKTDNNNPKLSLKEKKEPQNNWTLNLLFSDNGFGLGATLHKQLSNDVTGFASIAFSGSKDDREFDQVDVFGNSFTPYKVNRLFMGTINIGAQLRLFRDDVTDNLRPFVNFGISPTAIMYTPYSESFLSSFKYAQAKYTVGAFAGIGLDYVTNKHSSLSMNIRYYYINLFGQGVNSISTEEKKFFGGVYFVFGYNFMH